MTIKQLAESIGVSKTAIRKRMAEIPDFRANYTESDESGVIKIHEDGCKLIEESFRKRTETTENVSENIENKFAETPKTDVSAALVELLRAQLEAKDRQIDELNARLAETTAALTETTKSLQAAQALHAGTIQTQLLEDGENSSQKPAKTERKRGFFSRFRKNK